MMQAILFFNYLAVLVVTAVDFLFGWLWPSPLLAEMKITEDMMKEAAQKGMAFYFLQGFLYTLLGTFGLAVLLYAHRCRAGDPWRAIAQPWCMGGPFRTPAGHQPGSRKRVLYVTGRDSGHLALSTKRGFGVQGPGSSHS
jgi:hypothetical protein